MDFRSYLQRYRSYLQRPNPCKALLHMDRPSSDSQLQDEDAVTQTVLTAQNTSKWKKKIAFEKN